MLLNKRRIALTFFNPITGKNNPQHNEIFLKPARNLWEKINHQYKNNNPKGNWAKTPLISCNLDFKISKMLVKVATKNHLPGIHFRNFSNQKTIFNLQI